MLSDAFSFSVIATEITILWTQAAAETADLLMLYTSHAAAGHNII